MYLCVIVYSNCLAKQANLFNIFGIHMLNKVSIGKSMYSVKWQIQEFWEHSELFHLNLIVWQIFTKVWLQNSTRCFLPKAKFHTKAGYNTNIYSHISHIPRLFSSHYKRSVTCLLINW